MPWEYLDTPELDGRLLLAAGYLARRLFGKSVVDLNCMKARLLNYLPVQYAAYYCNDINYFPKNMLPWVDFQKKTDGEMVEYLKDKKVDILCVFGHGGGDRLPNKHESPTLTASAIQIIKDHHPEIVVLEACWDYVHNKRVLADILDVCLQKEGYLIKQNIVLKPSANYNELSRRNIIILEK